MEDEDGESSIRRSVRIRDNEVKRYDNMLDGILEDVVSPPELQKLKVKEKSRHTMLKEQGKSMRGKIKTLTKWIKKLNECGKYEEAAEFKKAVRKMKKQVRKFDYEISNMLKADEKFLKEKVYPDRIASVIVLDTTVIEKTTFDCICGKKFQTHLQLHEHVVVDHAEAAHCGECGLFRFELIASFVCPICSIVVEDRKNHLRVHYQLADRPDAPLECRLCPRQFRTVDEVMAHEEGHRLNPFVCKKCKEKFETREGYSDHTKIHTEFKKVAKDLTELQLHRNCKRNQCPLCSQMTLTRNDWWMHVLICSRTIEENTKQYRIAKKTLIGDENEEKEEESDEEKPTVKVEVIDLSDG